MLKTGSPKFMSIDQDLRLRWLRCIKKESILRVVIILCSYFMYVFFRKDFVNLIKPKLKLIYGLLKYHKLKLTCFFFTFIVKVTSFVWFFKVTFV